MVVSPDPSVGMEDSRTGKRIYKEHSSASKENFYLPQKKKFHGMFEANQKLRPGTSFNTSREGSILPQENGTNNRVDFSKKIRKPTSQFYKDNSSAIDCIGGSTQRKLEEKNSIYKPENAKIRNGGEGAKSLLTGSVNREPEQRISRCRSARKQESQIQVSFVFDFFSVWRLQKSFLTTQLYLGTQPSALDACFWNQNFQSGVEAFEESQPSA